MSVELRGVVEEIIFHNDENGYVIAVIEHEDEYVYVKGFIPAIREGETMIFRGRYVVHPTYGEQLEVLSAETLLPNTEDTIERYLSSGMIKGIGPSTAAKIVSHFGDKTLEIMQYDPMRMTEVEGIGKKKAEDIALSYMEQHGARDIMLFLQKYGLSAAYASRIYKTYGIHTKEVISENPYKLADEIRGIGFKMADQIAKRMGIDPCSPFRIATGIQFVLTTFVHQGHCFAWRDQLVTRATEILAVPSGDIEEMLQDLIIAGAVYAESLDGKDAVYPAPLYYAEVNVCKRLLDISSSCAEIPGLDIDDEIEAFEKRNDIDLAEEQKEAIRQAVQHGVLVVTGGPGTGKTTLVNGLLEIFEAEYLNVLLAAPTGRASKRMSEATGHEAKTIHRLLEYQYMEGEDTLGFQKTEDDPLVADVIIIDEMSMVDIQLMSHLMNAVAQGTRLILVGDVDQLPSVGPGAVLRDIIDGQAVNVVKLTEIFRQAQESMIVVNAHRINHGEDPLVNEKDKDFFFLQEASQKKGLATLKQLVAKRLPSHYNLDPIRDIQVLAPMKNGITGTKQLNETLQLVLNPPGDAKSEKQFGPRVFRDGDKVMQIKNNYQIKWRTDSGVDGQGVFNGDIGYVEAVDNRSKTLTVCYDEDKHVDYEFSQVEELVHAYAVTIHKSQGSEFPVVVLPIYGGPPMLTSRNILYTAVTRAKNLVVLVGIKRYMSDMVQNDQQNIRDTGLARRFQGIVEKGFLM